MIQPITKWYTLMCDPPNAKQNGFGNMTYTNNPSTFGLQHIWSATSANDNIATGCKKIAFDFKRAWISSFIGRRFHSSVISRHFWTVSTSFWPQLLNIWINRPIMTQILPDIVTFNLTTDYFHGSLIGQIRSYTSQSCSTTCYDLVRPGTTWYDLVRAKLKESNRNKSVQRNRFGPDPTQLNRDHSRINNGLTGLNQCL